MTSQELFAAGKLAEAVAAQTEAVKKHPADAAPRSFFCELLCLAGDLERADKQLDALSELDAQAAMGVAMFRQLLRAETARRECFEQGRVPELLDDPTPGLKLHLEAMVHLRAGDLAQAAQVLATAEEQRAPQTGECDGEPFDDFRDLDDLTAPVFEVLTTTGKYYWIPTERIELVEFHPPEHARDLLWRSAHMVVRGGPDGIVFVPALYPGSHQAADEQLKLGRGTDWQQAEGGPVRGVGQRTFLVGDQDRPIMELKTLTFTQT